LEALNHFTKIIDYENFILALGILFIGYSATAQITDPSYKSKVIELMNIQLGQGLVMDEMIKNIISNIADDKKEDCRTLKYLIRF